MLNITEQAVCYQGRTCIEVFTCCHTETEASDQTYYLTQPQYTYARPSGPGTDPVMPAVWQGGHLTTKVQVTGLPWLGIGEVLNQ